MPTTNWQPRAAKVTEVKTGVITGYDVATTYTITRNGKTVSVIAQGSAALTAAALVTAWNASTEVEMTEQTAANPSGGNITLTMKTSGVPSGTCTLTVSGGAGTVTNFSTTTAATGPWHVDNTANWSGAALPTTEDVQVDLGRGSMLYGLDQLTGTGLSLYVFSSGQTQNTIGLPENNAAGYVEDRARRLGKAFTSAIVECQSSFMRLDFLAVANTTEVRKTGTGSNGVPALLIAGSSASNVCEVLSGTVGLAYYADESYAGTTVRLSESATVIQGKNGGSITTINSHGTLELNGTFGTLNQYGGSSIVEGSATPTLVYVRNSECDYRASTPTAFKAGHSGIINCNNDLTPITVGTLTLEDGGKLQDKFQRVTITAFARGSEVEEISAA